MVNSLQRKCAIIQEEIENLDWPTEKWDPWLKSIQTHRLTRAEAFRHVNSAFKVKVSNCKKKNPQSRMNRLYFPNHFHEVREMMQNEQEKLYASFIYEYKKSKEDASKPNLE